MYRIFVLMALVIGSLAAPAELTLKVMSFNVRFGTALDGENSWPNRKDILVNAIKQYEPDVLGVQECLAFQADYITEQLPGYRWIGVDRDVSGKGEMTAVLYKEEFFFPIESGNFWLSETPDVPASKSWDTSLTRMTTWVRFHHPVSQTWFQLYNTHLDHRGEEARAQGVSVIARHMSALPESYPVILTGDFNAFAQQSRPYEVALEQGLTDAWTAAPTRVGPPVTFSLFKAPDPAADRRIDWILYRGAVSATQCETVIYNEDGKYPSDHYPVVATLQVTAK